jgi:chromosome segregation ATPase
MTEEVKNEKSFEENKNEKEKKNEISDEEISIDENLEEKDKLIEELKREIRILNKKLIKYQEEINDKELFIECKDEVDFAIENAKDEKIELLENKISKIKSNVKKLKDGYENEINKNLEIMKKQNKEYLNRESQYITQIKNFKNIIKKYELQVNQLIVEKTHVEDIMIKQEEELNNLVDKIRNLDGIIKKNNDLMKENQEYALKLIKIVEMQKNEIKLYKKRFKGNVDDNYKNKLFLKRPLSINQLTDRSEIKHKYHLTNYEISAPTLPKINTSNIKIMIEKEIENQEQINEFKSLLNNIVKDM